MKCSDCDRPLLKAALQIESRHGPRFFGPKRARRYIVKRTRAGAAYGLQRKPVAAKPDPRQLDWVEALAC